MGVESSVLKVVKIDLKLQYLACCRRHYLPHRNDYRAAEPGYF